MKHPIIYAPTLELKKEYIRKIYDSGLFYLFSTHINVLLESGIHSLSRHYIVLNPDKKIDLQKDDGIINNYSVNSIEQFIRISKKLINE